MEAIPSPQSDARAPFRLCSLEVFNWGPFSGLHQAEIDIGGTAIIGMTGSGKTTLVDAFVTLLTESPKYNLASTGGHESDRSLMSYVRGVIGSANASGDGANISRKGATTTGLCATYRDGRQTVRCIGLLWVEGVSTAYADLRRAWIFSRDPAAGLEQWLSIHHEGGLRALKNQVRDNELVQVYDSSNGGKRAYLARLRAFFDVGENAFDLLNRAAGLKQLNSIDELFREYVLDDRSSFDRAAEVADDFNTLTDIHNELVLARNQQAALFPVARLHDDWKKCEDGLRLRRNLKSILPVWFALNAGRLWGERAAHLWQDVEKTKARLDELGEQVGTAKSHETDLHARYLQAGGRDIDSLQELIRLKEQELFRRRVAAKDVAAQSVRFSWPAPVTAEALAENQRRAAALAEETASQKNVAEQEVFKIGSVLAGHEAEQERFEKERADVAASPGSNLPGPYQRFRAALAERLGLAPTEIPFVAELIQVKASEVAWRGAIERALGGHRLRLLVPTGHAENALRWVNHRDNRLHVRLWEAESAPPGAATFFPDGYVRKLEFKPHALREPLKVFLSSHDLHCVDSIEALRRTPHALNREGATSGRKGYSDKKDQEALDEGWCTGFDNRDRLDFLDKQIALAKNRVGETRAALAPAKRKVADHATSIQLLEAYAKVVFADIDVVGAETDCAQPRERLKALLAPESDAALAFQAYDKAHKATAELEGLMLSAKAAHASAETKHGAAVAREQTYVKRAGDGLSPEAEALAREHLPVPDSASAERIDDLEREAARRNDEKLDGLQKQQGELQKSLVRAMAHAKSLDNGALAEAGTDLADIPAYLERLRVLTHEALPEKLKRFLGYLNKSSDEGVTQLLNQVKGETDRIVERIADLNISLEGVDFKEGCFLQLVPQPVSHDSVRALEQAQRQLRAAMLRTDDQGESHYQALRHVVQLLRDAAEKKHTVGARALLDARFRLEFRGVEIDRATRREGPSFKGSQGGSGGEKEIIASYILTASLSYALSSDSGGRPLHATVVLDEAFSKSSRAVARRIAKALDEFGLHPIFVTPNKEMRLLREHTRSVVHVHRKDMRSVLACIRWEELDARVRSGASTAEPADEASVPAPETPGIAS